jgi:uroporphyrin-III C-methyltransferase/precorrin-2 dehydrogenase/sirohydrochlorin ferrochelatase
MDYLPIFRDVRGRTVIVAGGGTVAARRCEVALRAGARVRLFAESVEEDDFIALRDHPRLEHLARCPRPEDFAGAALAFAACRREEDDRRVAEMARAAGVPVNVADRPELCDFIMPSIVDRAPMIVAVSSSGASPILARMIRARLETMLPAAYGKLARFAGDIREKVMARLKNPENRRRFWERILEGPMASLVFAGDEEAARALMERELAVAEAEEKTGISGEVYLVGCGPGDPDLLTFKALRLMQKADVVLYDRLIGDGILNLVRREAERIYVGKRPGEHALPQEQITALMIQLAREGRRVLRLKGGDPFIFGRGGEEIERLAEERIPFQVVPGITAAAGCAAYAGIPLTHRDHAQSCLFITAHGRNGILELDWDQILRPHQTVAIYMGLRILPDLTAAFLEHGADPAMPAAVIEKGTRPGQRVVTGTLSDIAEKVSKAGFTGPAMIIVGTVVTLRDKLAWYAPDQQTAAEPLPQGRFTGTL